MLLQHGDFRGVELELTKSSEQLTQNDTKGGWYSELAMTKEGYTEFHGKQTSLGMHSSMMLILHATSDI